MVRWPGGQVAGGTEKIGEWGIPEKSIQNVAHTNCHTLHHRPLMCYFKLYSAIAGVGGDGTKTN